MRQSLQFFFKKVRLQFPKEQETLYRQSTFISDIKQIRVMYIIFIILFSLYAFIDLVLVKSAFLNFFLILRFGVAIPMFIFTLYLTFKSNFIRYFQIIVSINYMIGGLIIASMLILQPENTSYYGGLFLVLFSGLFLIRLTFKFASFATSVIFLYITLAIIFNLQTSFDLLIMHAFFFGLIIIGLFGLYNLEKAMRRSYLKEQIILKDKDSLSHLIDDQIQEIAESQQATIVALARLVEYKDINTGKHIEVTGVYCKVLAENLPDEIYQKQRIIKEEFIKRITFASVLHDIGKVGIPDYILNKPGKLTYEEFEIVKQHVRIGSDTLKEVQANYPNNAWVNMGIDIAEFHHERYDGKGYLKGLKGDEIPLSARIMSIVDVYDALRSQRPYKPEFSHVKTISIIKEGRGSQFDPLIVDVFLKIENIFEELSYLKKKK